MSTEKVTMPHPGSLVDSPTESSAEIWPRVLPFAAYMGFIGISTLLAWGLGSESHALWDLWSYPLKTVVVAILLIFFWARYQELRGPIFLNWQEGAVTVGVGLSVYALWVRMDWPWAIQGEMTDYDPFVAGSTLGILLAGFRLVGASVTVPIMEELFWRSFLIRYIVQSNFQAVRLGTYTIGSFALTVVLFGLEHNLWVAGMLAGVAYNLLLYWTGRLWPCIVAHAITNLVLGLHVLATGEWHWW
jgi:CAAX prenyl protease-like protein